MKKYIIFFYFLLLIIPLLFFSVGCEKEEEISITHNTIESLSLNSSLCGIWIEQIEGTKYLSFSSNGNFMSWDWIVNTSGNSWMDNIKYGEWWVQNNFLFLIEINNSEGTDGTFETIYTYSISNNQLTLSNDNFQPTVYLPE